MMRPAVLVCLRSMRLALGSSVSPTGLFTTNVPCVPVARRDTILGTHFACQAPIRRLSSPTTVKHTQSIANTTDELNEEDLDAENQNLTSESRNLVEKRKLEVQMPKLEVQSRKLEVQKRKLEVQRQKLEAEMRKLEADIRTLRTKKRRFEEDLQAATDDEECRFLRSRISSTSWLMKQIMAQISRMPRHMKQNMSHMTSVIQRMEEYRKQSSALGRHTSD